MNAVSVTEAIMSFAPIYLPKRNLRIVFLGLFVSYAVFCYLRFAGPELSIAYAQKLVSPLVFLTLTFAGFRFARVPLVVFFIAALLAGTGIYLGFGYSEYHQGTFLVGRLLHDDLETKSRILREKIREALPESSGVDVTRYHAALENDAIRGFLDQNPSLPVLVTNNKKNLRLTFQDFEVKQLNELVPTTAKIWSTVPSDIFVPLSKQRFVTMVPFVEVPLEPLDATARYLADLASGALGGYFQHAFVNPMEAERLLDLETAAVRGASWRMRTHQAFAAFLLGNYYFGQAFADAFQPGFFRCAIRKYAFALKMVSPYSNYPLYSAIYNNLGVIRSLQVYFEDLPENSKLARSNFQKAQEGAPVKSGSDRVLLGYRAASKNYAKMVVLRGNTEKVGKKRRKLAKQK